MDYIYTNKYNIIYINNNAYTSDKWQIPLKRKEEGIGNKDGIIPFLQRVKRHR